MDKKRHFMNRYCEYNKTIPNLYYHYFAGKTPRDNSTRRESVARLYLTPSNHFFNCFPCNPSDFSLGFILVLVATAFDATALSNPVTSASLLVDRSGTPLFFYILLISFSSYRWAAICILFGIMSDVLDKCSPLFYRTCSNKYNWNTVRVCHNSSHPYHKGYMQPKKEVSSKSRQKPSEFRQARRNPGNSVRQKRVFLILRHRQVELDRVQDLRNSTRQILFLKSDQRLSEVRIRSLPRRPNSREGLKKNIPSKDSEMEAVLDDYWQSNKWTLEHS